MATSTPEAIRVNVHTEPAGKGDEDFPYLLVSTTDDLTGVSYMDSRDNYVSHLGKKFSGYPRPIPLPADTDARRIVEAVFTEGADWRGAIDVMFVTRRLVKVRVSRATDRVALAAVILAAIDEDRRAIEVDENGSPLGAEKPKPVKANTGLQSLTAEF